MSTTPTSLKDSVMNAFVEAEKEAGGKVVAEDENVESQDSDENQESKGEESDDKSKKEKDSKETPDKKTDSTKEDEEKAVEVDASAEDIEFGLTLLRNLRNPAAAEKTLRDLAKIGGYDLTKPSEVKQLEKDTKTVLKEKLGDTYDFVGGDKLAEAFDALIEQRVADKMKPVQEQFTETEKTLNQQKADSAMDALWQRTKVPAGKAREEVAGLMYEKMVAMPAGPKANITSYLDDIYALVTRDQERTRTVRSTVKKINDNAKEVSRTSVEGSSDDDSRIRQGSKLPSIRESVLAAFDGKKLE